MSKAVSGYAYYTSAAWKRLIQGIPSSYTVWADNSVTPTVYRAECNLRGGTDYSDPDPVTVAQAAMDGLSGGRTWKERVVFKGKFPLTVPLTPPNYTILDLSDAQFVSRTTLGGCYFIDINGKSNVEVWGGFFTGDGDSPFDGGSYPENIYTSVALGITNGSSNIRAVGLETDHLWTAINVYGGSQKIMLRDIYTYKNAADIGIVPDTADIDDVNIIGCISPDGFDDTFALLSCIAGYHNISNVTISDCHSFKPTAAAGHAMVKIQASVGTIKDVNINNNILGNFQGATIDLREANVSDISITGNRLVSPSNEAIYIYNGVKKVRINGNPLIASKLTGDSRPIQVDTCANAGIDIVDNYIYGYGIAGFGLIDIHDSTYIDILNNRIKGLDIANTRGVNTFGTSDYVRVEGNRIENVPWPLLKVGTNNRIKSNVGYVTENSGTATITAAQTVIFAHGLSGIPTHVNVGFKTAGYDDWKWNADIDNIQIFVTTIGTYDLTWSAEYKP